MTGDDAERRDDSSGDGLTTVIEGGRLQPDPEEERALEAVKAGLFGASRRAVVLSRYVLLSRIGAGGLGVVFSAYDPDLDRKVAIKLLRAVDGEISDAGRNRLVREAQAIARVAHPNVIAVHDVGIYDEDLPPGPGIEPNGVFVVMELVEGADLHGWATETPRAWTETLRIFTQAGRGLAAAHEAGLVHRDFKPSNVLVGRDGRVRVLDFGLARASGARDPAADDRPRITTPSRTPPFLAQPLTQTGKLVGTPAYMSPEQHHGQGADARSDQFSFCVALYEALYGTRPYTARELAGIARQKRDGEIADPPTDSRVPRRVHAAVVRGLSPDPEDRYATMAGLLANLRTRRASGRWIATGVVGLTIGAVGSSAAIGWLADDPCPSPRSRLANVWDGPTRAAAASAFTATDAPFADSAWTSVSAELDAYAAAWLELRRNACVAARVEGQESQDALRRRERCLDRGLERLGELARVFAQADAAVVERAVFAVEELPPLQRCVEGPPPGESGRQVEPGQLGHIERALARAAASMAAGRFDDAAQAVAEAQAAAAEPEHAASLARALSARGELDIRRGRSEKAAPTLMRALAYAEQAGDERTATLVLVWLAKARLDQSQASDGAELVAIARAKLERHRLGARTELEILHTDGAIADQQGRFEAALAIGQRTLERAKKVHGETHTMIARAHSRIGAAYSALGRSEDAREHYRTALELYEARVGPDHPYVATALDNLATVETGLGSHRNAIALHRRAVELLERAHGSAHPQFGRALVNYANSLLFGNRLEEALSAIDRAIAVLEHSGRAEHPDTAMAMVNASVALRENKRTDEALRAVDHALPIMEASLGPRHPRTAVARANRGQILADLGRVDEGLAQIELARGIWVETVGEEHPLVGLALKATAEIELGRGRTRVALELLRSAIAKLERSADEPKELAHARLLVARALHPTEPRQAQELATQAVQAYVEGGGELEILRAAAPWSAQLGFIPPAG